MIARIVIATVYSCGTVLFYPCTEAFDYTIQLCGGPCFQLNPVMGQIDLVVTIYIPLSCIIFFNTFLVIRVILQKHRMLQKNIWKKNLGMLLQLLSITVLHVGVWMPCIIVILIILAHPSPSELTIQLQSSWVLINMIYIAVLGNPLVCIFAIPEIKEEVILLINHVRQLRSQQFQPGTTNQIRPLTTN